MRNTLKKISAAFAAAVLCAVPMASAMSANALANNNARYTFRQTYYVDGSAGVTKIVHSFAVKKTNTDIPTAEKISRYTNYTPYGSAGDEYYLCGGTLTNSVPMSGVVLSASTYCNSPSDFHASTSNFARGYKANGQESYNSVRSFNTFLVGDLNGDNKITNEGDAKLINKALNKGAVGMDFKSYVYVDGISIPAYKLDIDGNGYINWNDHDMIYKYTSGQITRFAK